MPLEQFTLKLAISFALFLIGCNQAPAGLAESGIVATQNGEVKFRVETVASGLEVPWSIAFLPNRRTLVTERPGRIRIIENGKLRAQPIHTISDVEPSSESGLMDLSLHPNFAQNNFLYLAYAYRGDGKRVRVVRFKFLNNKFTEPKTIIEDIPAAPNHAGTRCRFGPDGNFT